MNWGIGRNERTAEQLLPTARVLLAAAAPAPREGPIDLGKIAAAALLESRGEAVAPRRRELEIHEAANEDQAALRVTSRRYRVATARRDP